MKNNKTLRHALWMLLLIWGCGAGSQEQNADRVHMTEDSEIQNNEKGWQQVLAEKTPLEKEELYSLFPKSLGGFPLIGISDDPGFNGAIGTYCNEDETTHLIPHLALIITDGAGYHYFQHINEVNNIIESGYSQKNEKGHERIENLNGQKMIFVDHTKGDWFTSGISFIKNLRYQIKLEGNLLSTENLREPATTVQGLVFPD